jgi:uncharacterized protein
MSLYPELRRHCVVAFWLALLVPLSARGEPRIFDSHVHLWAGETSLDAYKEHCQQPKLNLAGAGVMWFGGPNQARAGRPNEIQARNDGLLALAAAHPTLVPIVTVHPYDGAAALAELERVAKKGAKVVKIHPHTQGFDLDDPRVLTLVRRAGELKVVTLIDNASILPGDCEKLFNLALQAPDTKFIFAHLGGMNFRFWNILRAARTAKGLFAENISFDISAIIVLIADSPMKDEFVWTMRSVGIDRLLFGSDYPQYTVAQNLEALDKLGLTEEEKTQVLYTNASTLLGLR